mgnify:CR=1 FL=1
MKIERMEELLTGAPYYITDWQKGFLQSVHAQKQGGRTLSEAQLNVLATVETQNTAEAFAERAAWADFFTSDQRTRETFKVACEYYNTGEGQYGGFRAIALKLMVDEDYVPTQKEYGRLCENEYAEKILAAHFSEPVFAAGSIVQFRAIASKNTTFNVLNQANGCQFKPPRDCFAVVLETGALPVRRPAKGSKVYKVLPFASPRTYYVHESDLKKARGLKK